MLEDDICLKIQSANVYVQGITAVLGNERYPTGVSSC
uniref:Uncharacterized protein n=1 Tax=Sphingobacterium sp. (strain 21) TaxID=743722 RepID=F4C2R0_SPHS2